MILGEYPCCHGDLCLSMPDNTPTFMPEECPHCGVKVWHLFSRSGPKTWIEADFRAEYDVDEETRQIKAKAVPD